MGATRDGVQEDCHLPQGTDYTLAKRAAVKQWRAGRVPMTDICDAQPALLRAAEAMGDKVQDPCPICDEKTLVNVSYAYGQTLRRHNGRICTRERLELLQASHDEFVCYVVEVCTSCSWNYLARRFFAGRAYAS